MLQVVLYHLTEEQESFVFLTLHILIFSFSSMLAVSFAS